jgi:transmembrane sensor
MENQNSENLHFVASERSLSDNFKKTPPHTGNIRLVWIKALTVPISILVIVGSFAILSGSNKQKPSDWVYVHAINGKKNVLLPDGSKIALNKGSSVAYKTDFGKTRRYVKLTGEAYFEVQYDSLMPFNVQSLNEITATTGTSFLIRSTDSIEVVIVSKGEVKLENKKDKGHFITLTAGQRAELTKDTIISSSAPEINKINWKNEQIIFNQSSLKQAAEDLIKIYGVPITFSENVKPESISITAKFYNQPLKQVLDEIATKSALTVDSLNGVFKFTLPEANKITSSPVITQSTIVKPTSPPIGSNIPHKKKKQGWIKRIFAKK